MAYLFTPLTSDFKQERHFRDWTVLTGPNRLVTQ